MIKKRLGTAAIAFVLLLGISILFYPIISNWIAQKNRTLEIIKYDDSVRRMEKELLLDAWAQAEEYNRNRTEWKSEDAFSGEVKKPLPDEYLAVLNIESMMGYVEIPKIKVYLPIYHGASEDVLKKGAGHLHQSSLPVGGIGNHAVITGHTGLPAAKLFTGLDKLIKNDIFYLHILDRTFAYRVDKIAVVEPEDIDSLFPDEGEDYVTLITCTPYGINSHRLLVRGKRTEIPIDGSERPVDIQRTGDDNMRWLVIVLLFLTLVILVTHPLLKRKKARKKYG